MRARRRDGATPPSPARTRSPSAPPEAAAFGLWVEQLIAESTGKQGKGCVPIPTTDAEAGDDRFNVSVTIGDAVDLGAEFQRWEIATAIAGHVLGIDPFDEPNVTESKENTKRVLADLPLPDIELEDPSGVSDWLADTVEDGDYVSIQAYRPYGEDEALSTLRRRLRERLGGAPVTPGSGRASSTRRAAPQGRRQQRRRRPGRAAAPTAKLDIPGFPATTSPR